MFNPIDKRYPWDSLYQRYDDKCKGFDADSPCLYAFSQKPINDRSLYYMLVDAIKRERNTSGFITLRIYEAILYWKLNSQPCALWQVCKKIRSNDELQRNIETGLRQLGQELPLTIEKKRTHVDELYLVLNRNAALLHGMKSPNALPVRTTLLHFLYPEVVPLYDKQVLAAVGITAKDANKDKATLKEYIQFAWSIAENPEYIPQTWRETPLRLLDMALWVIRSSRNK